jgi:hypothetical protein
MIRGIGVFALAAVAMFVVPAAAAHADGLLLETEAGTWCDVASSRLPVSATNPDNPDSAACQGDFRQITDGSVNIVSTSGDGTIQWSAANLCPLCARLTMTYGQTYTYGNWTIYPDATGTRFTNTRTGHGMFVSKQDVYAF